VAVIFTDNTTRADSITTPNPASDGGNYTIAGDTTKKWGIETNLIRRMNTTATSNSYCLRDGGLADGTFQFKCPKLGINIGGSFNGMIWRGNGTDMYWWRM
jgi:hypothetical protein